MIRRLAGIDLETREMRRADRDFIAVRFGRGRLHREFTDLILDGALVIVWCSSSSPTTVHGYCATHGPTLLDVFILKPLRGHGLARDAMCESWGTYPERIESAVPWPWPSARFANCQQKAA